MESEIHANDKKAAFIKAREEGQEQLHSEIAGLRFELFAHLAELPDYNAKDRYDLALLKVVTHVGDNGITTSKLHDVMPDSKLLAEARNRLVKAGKIEQRKDGNSWLLTAVEQPSAEPAA